MTGDLTEQIGVIHLTLVRVLVHCRHSVLNQLKIEINLARRLLI